MKRINNMKKTKFLACAILFFVCVVNSNARIGYYYTANCFEYCDELVVPLGDFVAGTDLAGHSITMNLLDSLTEGEPYRIKVTRCYDENTFLYSYNIYVTYHCDLGLSSEELELLDYIDYGSLADEDGNGLHNIAGNIPYNEDELWGDYEPDEFTAMTSLYGLHFLSVDDVNTYPILIEVYRLGEEDEAW